MFRARLGAVLGLIWMLAVGSAEAGELGLALDGRVGGDSNVLRSSFDKVDDAFFEFSPRFSVRETQRELTYDFFYRPTFTTYAETEGIDGVDHLITGSSSWRFTPRDNLSASLRYGDRRQLRFDDADPTPILLLVPSDRSRIRLTTARVSYSRQLTPVWSGYFSLDLDDFDSAPDDFGSLPDTRAYSGRIGGDHAFNQKTSAGLSASGRFRDTKAQGPSSAKALIWDVSINLSQQLSDTMSISLQVGPSFISTKIVPDIALRDFVPTTFTQQTSIFASANFEKSWRKARFNASYVRSEFRGGISVSSTFSDEVDVDFVYDLTRRLVARMNASWNQRKQIVDIEGFGNLDTTQWRAVCTLSYRLSRQLNLIGQYAFRTQEVKGRANFTGVGDIHTGFLSLRYTFDPIIF